MILGGSCFMSMHALDIALTVLLTVAWAELVAGTVLALIALFR